jgi:hypothetical protein
VFEALAAAEQCPSLAEGVGSRCRFPPAAVWNSMPDIRFRLFGVIVLVIYLVRTYECCIAQPPQRAMTRRRVVTRLPSLRTRLEHDYCCPHPKPPSHQVIAGILLANLLIAIMSYK